MSFLEIIVYGFIIVVIIGFISEIIEQYNFNKREKAMEAVLLDLDYALSQVEITEEKKKALKEFCEETILQYRMKLHNEDGDEDAEND